MCSAGRVDCRDDEGGREGGKERCQHSVVCASVCGGVDDVCVSGGAGIKIKF